ncbi:Histidyl-tRNA synthetase [Labilithrix luteola]|uniref:Histidine--tRNA ligase n=1 Tax=Labilithrix luteola TaxID=1391654 RepID=A0A0K1Q9G6_9BACT|nr:Histidyl-tRNA synthetase [Labilithrix luteola]
MRHQFELHGFTPLQTRSIELASDLLGEGGDTDKEIYGVQRLAAEPSGDSKLALHFDLTVPFARYVVENRSALTFPFRRYQVQQAWRGERPQLGRYREFLQADADVIASGSMDVRFDREMVALLRTTLDALPIPNVRLLVNNRKLLEGFYRGLGIHDITGTLRIVDKIAKIGPAAVVQQLMDRGLTATQAEKCVAVSAIEIRNDADAQRVLDLGERNDLLDEGLRELLFVLSASRNAARPDSIVGALSIARGLDYYTGTVVEGVFEDHPKLSAVCSGGRYDNLASGRSKEKLPGVGVSIGITRIMGYCAHLGLLKETRPRRTPAAVYVLVHAEDEREASEAVARGLRKRGIAALVSDSADAYGKQIRSANQLGVPYVWFPARGEDGQHEVKDLLAGHQTPADPTTWVPTPVT